MTSPTLELQGAIVAKLKATGTVTALIGTRIYDSVPSTATFPYVSFGPEQILEDDAECITGFEVFMQLDAWSRGVGFPEVKRIAEAVRKTLHDFDLVLTDNALVSFQHRQTRVFRDPDGLTAHAAIEFIGLVEQP